tara:strand:+ start:276 stop:983 length:708 start_codon:yes stop_codon:yes gene_type:complete
MNEDKVLVIVPTYNESKIIKDVLHEIKKYFNDAEILVIDGYSTDNTISIAKDENVRSILIDKTFGISLAVEAGILEAFNKKVSYLVRIDGDGQHPVKDVNNILNFAIQNKIDLLIGSRFLEKADYETNNLRLLGIKLLKKLLKIFYKVDISDCTSGCQVFSKRLIKELIEDKNFEYSEIGAICKTKKIGYSIQEKFINMRPRITGTSSFNFVNSFKYMFKNLLAIITSASFNLRK